MFNQSQPPRPDFTADGNPLSYRTQPKQIKRRPRFYSAHQMVSAMRLYRAACNLDIPQGVAIGELYEFVFYTEELKALVSKNTMGSSVIHSVLYEPRVLKNTRETGALMTYQFREIDDLRYGLEWQICAPLYHWFLKNDEWPKDQAEWIPKMAESLKEIGNSDETEYVGLYEEPLIEDSIHLTFKEPDWNGIARRFPERELRIKPRNLGADKPKTPPRDLS